MVAAKNIVPEKARRLRQTKLRQNSVKGQKYQIVQKKSQQVTSSTKICQKLQLKSAKLRHYSLLPEIEFFTQTWFVRFCISDQRYPFLLALLPIN